MNFSCEVSHRLTSNRTFLYLLHMYVWISMSCYRYVIVYHYHCFWHCIIVHCSMTRAASTFWKPPPNSDQDLKYFWMAWESVTSLRRSSKSYDRHLSTAIDQNNLSPGTKTQILTRLAFFVCLFCFCFLFFVFFIPNLPELLGWLITFILLDLDTEMHKEWNLYTKTTIGINKMHWYLYAGSKRWAVHPWRPSRLSLYNQIILI